MLRPNANRDKTRGDALQPGKPTNEAQQERRPKRPTAGLQRHADDVVLNDNLHGLRHLHREFAPAYAASKGGIVQFTRSCAVAWAPDNIQANAVLPGWIDTDLTKRAREQIDGLHDKVLARTPAARWGEPADFAGIAVFLASGASDFVTGTAIPIDGGFSVMG